MYRLSLRINFVKPCSFASRITAFVIHSKVKFLSEVGSKQSKPKWTLDIRAVA
jgi:hypothetical protein